MTADVSRRRALQLAGLGLVATAAGGAGLWRGSGGSGSSVLDARTGTDLVEPPTVVSRDGRLDVRLEAAAGVTLAGRRTAAYGYNGTSPGPTLRVRPGDLLRVELVNRLDAVTNLHTHGLHVSPEGNSDNILVRVAPGEAFHYEYRIPEDHPAGTFWYHPHVHGHVAEQVFGGLVGALVVDRSDVDVDRDRVLVVTDTTLDMNGRLEEVSTPERTMGREGRLVLVNGQVRPRLTATSGDVERWRVVNGCSSRFLNLQLDGHALHLLGYDGQGLAGPFERRELLLAPGNRVDVLVQFAAPGEHLLRAVPYDRGGMGPGMMVRGDSGSSAGVTLATAVVTPPQGSPRALPVLDSRVPDLRQEPVDARRTLTFAMGMGMDMGMGMGGMSFTIDGKEFDPDRVDQHVRLGTTEEWTIRNASPMDHPFHLHVWPFQLVDPNADGAPDWRDTVNVPAGGRVRIRVRFEDVAGRTVYHCHVLDHEDNGMMGVIEVT